MTESQKLYFGAHGCIPVSMVEHHERHKFEQRWKRKLNQVTGEFVYVPRLPERNASKEARVEANA